MNYEQRHGSFNINVSDFGNLSLSEQLGSAHLQPGPDSFNLASLLINPISDSLTNSSHYTFLNNILHVNKSCSRSNDRVDKHQNDDVVLVPAATRNRKSRVRWTKDLHHQFVRSVELLGGATKATPKGILNLMSCEGLTIFHVKSHLQKYRVAQLMLEATKGAAGNTEQQLDSRPSGAHIVEALRLQMDFQRLLYKQLQSQKKLQQRIEEQAKQLRAMIHNHSHYMRIKY